MKRLLIIWTLTLTITEVWPQTIPPEELLEQFPGENEGITESNLQQLSEQLEQLKKEPVFLNYADEKEMNRIFFLDRTRSAALIKDRTENGNIKDWEELYRIPGFSWELIEQLKPYASLDEKFTRSKISDSPSIFTQIIRVSSILKDQAGYNNSSKNSSYPNYEGDRLRIYTRTRLVKPGILSAGVVTEKDPGEKWVNSKHPYNPDLTSAHLMLSPKTRSMDRIVFGDFNLSSGCGLVFSNGIGAFKSAQTMAVLQPSAGLTAASSVNEYHFFRGIGASFRSKHWEISPILSSKKLDATYNPDSTDFGNFLSSGLHRTRSELNSRKQARENTAVVSFSYSRGQSSFGSNLGLWNYQMKNINDRNFSLVSVFYKYQLPEGILFGELASNGERSTTAAVAGLIASLSNNASLSISYRYYPKTFVSPMGASFSHSGRMTNEEGIYIGLEYRHNSRISFTAYIDQYSYPFPSFYTQFPARQKDILLQSNYQQKKKFSVYLRARYQLLQFDDKTEPLIKSKLTDKLNWRLHAQVTLSEGLVAKFRIETVSRTGSMKGLLSFMDLSKKAIIKGLSLSGRLGYFQAVDYQDRIYAFENDMPYSLSIPAYYGEGWRSYLIVGYTISDKWRLWMRYSNWLFQNTTSVGSGNELIIGNTKPQLSLQLSYAVP